jgi:hypothetical protein
MSDAFAQALAQAKQASGGVPQAANEPAETPEAETPESDDEVTEDAADGADGDATGDDEPEEGDDAPASEITLDEVKALFADGKLKELAKRLGQDPDALEVHPAKLRKLKRTETELTERETEVKRLKGELAAKQVALTNKEAELSRRGGKLDAIERAVAAGDWLGVADAIEGLLPEGTNYAKLTQLVAQGARGGDPAVLRELNELKQKMLEREAREKEHQTASTRERDRGHVREQLAKHELSKLDGFEDAVIAEMHKAWDPSLKAFNKTLKQVADELLTKEKARASKLLGAKPATSKRPVARPVASPRSDDGRFVVPSTPSTPDKDHAFKSAYAAALRQSRGAR